MSKSTSNEKDSRIINIPKTVREDLEKELPREIAEEILALGRKEKIDAEKLIEKLQKLPIGKRNYAILPMLYYTNNNKVAEKILLELLDDAYYGMKEKIIIYLAHRKNEAFKKKIPEYLKEEDENLKTLAIWAMAYMGMKNNLFEKIKEQFPKMKDDHERITLMAALYHLNKNPKSKEMQYLKKLFLTEYYDEKEGEFISEEKKGYNRSTIMIADILWDVGIKIVKKHFDEKFLFTYRHLIEEIK
ncbi:MAG: hypothetical protein K9W42_07940 [Candidatus Heimdallarchaeota archaeon]|nr:hypothetical protein [Candidatus Heimdallarchaeota archaeon]